MDPKDRFKDNPNMLISDEATQNLWLPKDSYGDLGKWVTWKEVEMYLGTMRQVYAGGFNDWRLPTLEEALTLYHDDYELPDFEGQMIHIPPVFVPKCGYYLWTSEVNDKGEAVRVNLRDGTHEFVDQNTKEHHVARGMRTA